MICARYITEMVLMVVCVRGKTKSIRKVCSVKFKTLNPMCVIEFYRKPTKKPNELQTRLQLHSKLHTTLHSAAVYFIFLFFLSFHLLFSHRRKVFKVTVGISTCCFNGCSVCRWIQFFFLRLPFTFADYGSLNFSSFIRSFFMHHNCDFLLFSMHSLCTLFLNRFLCLLASLTFCVWMSSACLPLPWLELWISCSKYM